MHCKIALYDVGKTSIKFVLACRVNSALSIMTMAIRMVALTDELYNNTYI